MEELLQELCGRHKADFLGKQEKEGRFRISVGPAELYGLLSELFRNNPFWCDFLQCISAEHIIGTTPMIQLHYHLESIPHGFRLQLSCHREIPENNGRPVFPSVADLWQTANWHEREAAELYGIHFEGHPDLRPLLLPSDWKGFPMRKDYLPEEKYHGLVIKAE